MNSIKVEINGIPCVPHPAKAEEAYPRVYRSGIDNAVRVYLSGPTSGVWYSREGRKGFATLNESELSSASVLLTGPEAAEYVAAAREGRDAVWPPKAEEWPKCFKCGIGKYAAWFGENDGLYLIFGRISRADGPLSKEKHPSWHEITGKPEASDAISAAEAFRARETWPKWWTGRGLLLKQIGPTETVYWHTKDGIGPIVCLNGDWKKLGYTELTSPEAAALLAKWEAERKPKPSNPERFLSGQRVRFDDGRVATVTEVHPPCDQAAYSVRLDNGATDKWYHDELEYAGEADSPPRDLPGAEEVAEKCAEEIANESEKLSIALGGSPKSYSWLGTYRLAPIIARCILQDRKARGE